MPYSNVPKDKWGKMDRCVQRVMASQNVSKDSAIGICHDSVVKEINSPMASKRNRNRRMTKSGFVPPVAVAAQSVMGDDQTDEDEIQDEQDEEEGAEEKSYYYDEPQRFTYGATSLAALAAAREADEKAMETNLLADDLQGIIRNILMDDSITNKGSAIGAATKEFESLIRSSGKKEDEGAQVAQHKPTFVDKLIGALKAPFEKKSAFKTGITVFKSIDGAWRWLGVSSNKFQDRQGEIISEAAHKEFMEYLDANPGDAPVLLTWHLMPTARKARADFWDYSDGFVIFGGPLTEAEAKQLERLKESYELGMSHGFYPLAYNEKDKSIIEKYRSFEVSALPASFAANPWTTLDVITKEADMPLNPNKRKILLSYLSEEEVATIEQNLAQGKDALEKLGVKNKEAGQAAADGATPTAGGEEPTELTEVVKAIAQQLGLDKLSALMENTVKRIDAIESGNKEIKELAAAMKKSDDERIAEQITPPVSALFWLRSQKDAASGEEVTETDKADEKLQGPSLDGEQKKSDLPVNSMIPRFN